MKRWFLLGIAVCLFAALTGCNEEADNPSMYIEPAQLTEEEVREFLQKHEKT